MTQATLENEHAGSVLTGESTRFTRRVVVYAGGLWHAVANAEIPADVLAEIRDEAMSPTAGYHGQMRAGDGRSYRWFEVRAK